MRLPSKFALAAIIALAPVMLAVPATAQVFNSPASTYLYPFRGMAMAANSDSFSIAKYVVQGTVRDDQGLPVEGAALHVGKELVYTDSSGRFLMRFSKRGPFPLSVAPDEFINNGVYQVVSAPSQVSAEPEDSATDVQVVVKRVPPPQAKLYRQ